MECIIVYAWHVGIQIPGSLPANFPLNGIKHGSKYVRSFIIRKPGPVGIHLCGILDLIGGFKLWLEGVAQGGVFYQVLRSVVRRYCLAMLEARTALAPRILILITSSVLRERLMISSRTQNPCGFIPKIASSPFMFYCNM